jgi:quinol monooxygenase YgiN
MLCCWIISPRSVIRNALRRFLPTTGVFELPFLRSLGVEPRYTGRNEITALVRKLLEIYPNFAFAPDDTRIPTLQEQGCEALSETGRQDDPHRLVFFEIFSSAAAHRFHLEQDYAKRMFASLDGKVSGVPTLTKLSALHTSV